MKTALARSDEFFSRRQFLEGYGLKNRRLPAKPRIDSEFRNSRQAEHPDRMGTVLGTVGVEHMKLGAIQWLDACRATVRRTVPGTVPSGNSSARDPRAPAARPLDADAPPTSARQVSGANPRLANARVNSSLNAERREYCCRRSATHFESSASRPFGANARHDATSKAAWP